MTQMRLFFVYLLMLVSVPVFAGPSTIGGTVKNEWGDAMMGAHVRLVDQPYGAVVGSMDGSYEIKHVDPGMYDILYTNPAYDSLLVLNVPLDPDTVLVLHAVLTLATSDATLDTVWFTTPPAPAMDADSLQADSARADSGKSAEE
jgi:hypothetical protein